jgi:hypothetical protein
VLKSGSCEGEGMMNSGSGTGTGGGRNSRGNVMGDLAIGRAGTDAMGDLAEEEECACAGADAGERPRAGRFS